MTRVVWTALLGALVAASALVVAAPPAEAASQPVLFVVDTSGSMGGQRIQDAKSALTTSFEALADDQPAGLRSYAGGCGDGGVLRVPVGVDNRTDLADATASLTAGGGTPTPDALVAAAGNLPDGAGTIVLISDGQSTCGDPCPTAESLADEYGIDFKVHTVGFQATDTAEGELACIADVTGGSYVSVDDEEGLQDAIGDVIGGAALGQFVVMGDSYSSGEGVGTYTEESGRCHRSRWAWGAQVDGLSDTATMVANLACSGAKTDHLLTDDRHGETPQIEQLQALRDADVQVDAVLFTIGGNDVGFTKILFRCWETQGFKPSGCERHPVLRNPEHHVDERVFDRLRGQDGVIARIGAIYPDAKIILSGYPRLFPEDHADSDGCNWLTEEELDAVNHAQNVMTVRGFWLAEDTEAYFVSVKDAIDGRELCTEQPYYQPIGSTGTDYFSAESRQEMGHPTSVGYTRWAQTFLAELEQQGLN